jgi:chaperonin GroES
MKFRPLTDRVLIKRLDGEEKSAGGIIIPDAAKEKPMQGKVMAVGPGKVLDNGTVHALEVKEGDTVYFRKYAGTDVEIAGEEHLILREDEVLAILDD